MTKLNWCKGIKWDVIKVNEIKTTSEYDFYFYQFILS